MNTQAKEVWACFNLVARTFGVTPSGFNYGNLFNQYLDLSNQYITNIFSSLLAFMMCTALALGLLDWGQQNKPSFCRSSE